MLPLNLDYYRERGGDYYGRIFAIPYFGIYDFNDHKCRLIVYYIHNVD